VTLNGAMASPDVVPRPNPLRTAAVEQPLPSPESLSLGVQAIPAAPAPAAPPAAAPAAEQTAQKPEEKPKEKSGGFLSGIFGH